MIWIIYDKATGRVRRCGRGSPEPLSSGESLATVETLPSGYDPEKHELWYVDGTILLKPRLPTSEEIDKQTESAINRSIHRYAPWGEQIGILRDQLVHVLNALGIEPTPEFARLNEIAIKEIEAAREKKEMLNAQDDTS